MALSTIWYTIVYPWLLIPVRVGKEFATCWENFVAQHEDALWFRQQVQEKSNYVAS